MKIINNMVVEEKKKEVYTGFILLRGYGDMYESMISIDDIRAVFLEKVDSTTMSKIVFKSNPNGVFRTPKTPSEVYELIKNELSKK